MQEKMGKQEIYAFLQQQGIAYDCLEHDAVHTMEDMIEAGITQKGVVCKNLFLRDAKGRRHFLLSVPHEKAIDLHSLPQKIGSTRLSFGSAERLMKYLGVEQGMVSPLGILNDQNAEVTVIFDRDLIGQKAVGVHPNDNTATVWLSFEDLRRLIRAHGNEIMLAEFDLAEP